MNIYLLKIFMIYILLKEIQQHHGHLNLQMIMKIMLMKILYIFLQI